jgi:hypothetical protein
MKKVKIVATAAALAVGGFLALESAAQSSLTLTVHGFSTGGTTGGTRGGVSLTFDEMSTAQEMGAALCSQVDTRFGGC